MVSSMPVRRTGIMVAVGCEINLGRPNQHEKETKQRQSVSHVARGKSFS